MTYSKHNRINNPGLLMNTDYFLFLYKIQLNVSQFKITKMTKIGRKNG